MDAEARKKNMLILKVSYALLVLFPIASVIICYVMRGDVRDDPVMPSHCNWQIKTFWVSLALGLVGIVLTSTLIGAVVGGPLLLGVWIWCIYRAIKGFLTLDKNAAVPA